jgi:hypothetical protein
MAGFVAGLDREQATLLPECLEDWVDESNPVGAVDVFVDALELRDLGFDSVDPAATGWPTYHPSACTAANSIPNSIACGRLYFVQVAALPAPRAPCWGLFCWPPSGRSREQF